MGSNVMTTFIELDSKINHHPNKIKNDRTASLSSSILPHRPCWWRSIPILSQEFWYCYGTFLTVILSMGHMSLMRPACDILIAGATQAFPTMYLTLSVTLYLQTSNRRMNKRESKRLDNYGGGNNKLLLPLIFYAFYINSPLMPLYPVFSIYLSWPLPVVNTVLHAWLTMAWTLQYVSMRMFSSSVLVGVNDDDDGDDVSNNKLLCHTE